MSRKKKQNIRKRLPVRLTFIRQECDDSEQEKIITEKMIAVTEMVQATEVIEIIMKKGQSVSTKLRDEGLPELWLHDFENEEMPLQPFGEFYIIEFNDGSKKAVLILRDEPIDIPQTVPEIMYQ